MAQRVTDVTGVDVSHPRAHTGHAATRATEQLGAHGFRLGPDVALAPGTSSVVPCHELGRVAKQDGERTVVGPSGYLADAPAPDTDLELQADAIAASA